MVEPLPESFYQAYAAYLNTLRPAVRAIRPYDVRWEIAPIVNIIRSQSRTPLNTPPFAHVWQRMDEVYAEDEKWRIAFFKNLLPEGWVGRNEGGIAALERANAVFHCTQHPQASLIGWSMSQMCQYELSLEAPDSTTWHVRLRVFDAQGSALAGTLVSLVGLDPATATAAQMDSLDRRFCNRAWATPSGYGVYTWRSVVSIVYPFD